MKLWKSDKGWIREKQISAGGKWRVCGVFYKKEHAEKMIAKQQAKGRRTRLHTYQALTKSAIKKHGEGRICFAVEIYHGKFKHVRCYATAEECNAHGAMPGVCNL